MKSFERMLMSIVLTAGLVAGTIPSAAHSGCLRWPFSGGVLSLQHYVSYVDFGSYPEYRDAINDWNQPATPIWFYDGGSPQSYQVKSVTSSYTETWPGLAIVYTNGCTITDAVVLLNTRLLVNYTYADRRHVECQELGHTPGLNHNDIPTGSCMNDATYWQYYISTHDIDDVNLMYP